eukprot:407481-Rhodomonas_salina.1
MEDLRGATKYGAELCSYFGHESEWRPSVVLLSVGGSDLCLSIVVLSSASIGSNPEIVVDFTFRAEDCGSDRPHSMYWNRLIAFPLQSSLVLPYIPYRGRKKREVVCEWGGLVLCSSLPWSRRFEAEADFRSHVSAAYFVGLGSRSFLQFSSICKVSRLAGNPFHNFWEGLRGLETRRGGINDEDRKSLLSFIRDGVKHGPELADAFPQDLNSIREAPSATEQQTWRNKHGPLRSATEDCCSRNLNGECQVEYHVLRWNCWFPDSMPTLREWGSSLQLHFLTETKISTSAMFEE